MVLKKLKQSIADFRKSWPHTRRAMKEVNAIHYSIDPILTIMDWGGSVFGQLSSFVSFAVFGTLLQTTLTGYLENAGFTEYMITVIIAVFIVYYISTTIAEGISRFRRSLFDDKFELYHEQLIIKKLWSLDVGRLNDPGFIHKSSLAQGRGRRAISSLKNSQQELFAAIIATIVSFSFIVSSDPLLLALVLLPAFPTIISQVITNRKRRHIYETRWPLQRKKNEYEDAINENLLHARLFNSVEYFWSQFEKYRQKFRIEDRKLEYFDLKANTMTRTLAILSVTIALVYAGNGLSKGSITIGELVLYTGGLFTLMKSVASVPSGIVRLGEETLNYRYLQNFLDEQPLIDESNACAVEFKKVPSIYFNNVTFSYPRQEDRQALTNCKFTIEPCERIAIIGQNGSGKTTIARIISKIYLPTSGEVYLNEIPTHHILQSSWLKHVMYATQDSSIPELPIDEALTGTESGTCDMARLIQAATITKANEFIETLPKKYQTQLGEDWEDGSGFSSGQMQRLKLTGALYRISDPNVHIGVFDEPMSNCDIETRNHFYSSLQEFKNKTIIVIAHDPMFLHYFERVIVIQDGSVIDDIRGLAAIEHYKETCTDYTKSMYEEN